MSYELIILLLVVAGVSYFLYTGKRANQLAYIQNYRFHRTLSSKIKARYPHLTDTQVAMVFDGLTDYFYVCSQANKRLVSMPSQVVDAAWHEFILFTWTYQNSCNKAIGRFLHHTPTEAMKTSTLAQEGIKLAWRLSCAKENIRPSRPLRLPLLFATDGLLKIEDGYTYSLNCKDKSSPLFGDGYCAEHTGGASGCQGDSADSSDPGGFFDASGDSSGCGGD